MLNQRSAAVKKQFKQSINEVPGAARASKKGDIDVTSSYAAFQEVSRAALPIFKANAAHNQSLPAIM